MARVAVGVDIGGTKVAIGVVDERGEVLAERTIPMERQLPPGEMAGNIADEIKLLAGQTGTDLDRIAGIGIGAPGPLDPGNGVITCPPNLPNWRGFPLVAAMQEYFRIPIHLENDASAAALAEKWIGAAQDNDSFAYVTISTGIGAGFVLGGKLFTGASGNAGDIGHMAIDPAQGTCTCGQQGCFEFIASGTAIARKGSELLGRAATTKEIFALYATADPVIKPYVEQVFTYIGMGCVTLINLLDLEKIVIGGGVSQVGEPLFRAVREYVGKFALNPGGRQVAIVPSPLVKHTGLIGAAALVLCNR